MIKRGALMAIFFIVVVLVIVVDVDVVFVVDDVVVIRATSTFLHNTMELVAQIFIELNPQHMLGSLM